jgi:hypothetical protein
MDVDNRSALHSGGALPPIVALSLGDASRGDASQLVGAAADALEMFEYSPALKKEIGQLQQSLSSRAKGLQRVSSGERVSSL